MNSDSEFLVTNKDLLETLPPRYIDKKNWGNSLKTVTFLEGEVIILFSVVHA